MAICVYGTLANEGGCGDSISTYKLFLLTNFHVLEKNNRLTS